jgi:hypothetical protein
VRSPRNIAWIDGARVGDFVLEADVLYTGRDYGHADLCFFLGGTTPSQFYYAHVAHDADPNANSVFIVNDADRTGIALERSGGQPWGSDWRKVRVQRIGPAISVFLDGERVMHANDATHGAGEVGLGSFDDTGRFDNIRLHGEVLR